MAIRRLLFGVLFSALLAGFPALAPAFITFADEDRSAELASEPVHQRYQFNTPTTVTYDMDTLGTNPANVRVYVADMGNHEIQVLNLNGQRIGALNDSTQSLAADSPHASVPEIRAPLGIAFLSESEADDNRLAGLYVNDVGLHQIHYYRTVSGNPNAFEYVTSIGTKGTGGGDELKLPRNMVITPQGFIYVSDEFNHRIKAFRIDPDLAYQVTLVQTLGWQQGGSYVPAGPIIRGVDKNYGSNSTHYDDYASDPDKRDGFRIPQGVTYYRDVQTGQTYVYVADNGSNRVKIYAVDTGTGQLSLLDMIGRFRNAGGSADHLKRPRGLRTDAAGNLYIADTYNGRIIKLPNIAGSGDPHAVKYRSSGSADAQATWVYGRLGIHQIEMRTPATAGTEDAAFQLPNDLVPLVRADGSIYRENIWAWGVYYTNARVHLVSDTGNHRIKKCWSSSSGQTLLRCSVSAGVGGQSNHEFWGHPRTLQGQLHAVSGMAYFEDSNRLLVSDTPNTRINIYDHSGNYLGRFPGTNISYGVMGINAFTDGGFGESVAVLVAADATLPWPYTGDSSLRVYSANGTLRHIFNLTYRTTGLAVPRIAFTNSNFPMAVSVRSETSRQHQVYLTSFGGYAWRFNYNASNGTLTGAWYSGGPDAAKGDDLGSDWSLGAAFFDQGAAGTFDQIHDVLALDDRVYVVDRRNQRVQALNPSNGALLGQMGQGGGTYDHPDGLDPEQFFLPVGLAYDAGQDAVIVGDSFNMVARAWSNPDGAPVAGDGSITPAYQGHWLDPDLGTRPGGLFAAEHVETGGGAVFVYSLISNRITRFQWSEINQ